MQDTDEKVPQGKREARKQERREAILNIAARSFFEQGYAGTSMSAIAAELGGSKGTLWNYFRSKEELFEAVLDDRTAAYRAQVDTVLDANADLRTTLFNYCRGFITKVTSCDGLALHRLVAAESGRFPEVGRIFNERAPRATQLRLGRFLEAHMIEGRLRRDDPLAAARALTSLCLGSQHMMLWGAAPPDPLAIEVEASFATETFLRAFAPES